MPSSGLLTKAKIINADTEINRNTRKKSIDSVNLLLELIKHSQESGYWRGYDAETYKGCQISMLGEAEGEE